MCNNLTVNYDLLNEVIKFFKYFSLNVINRYNSDTWELRIKDIYPCPENVNINLTGNRKFVGYNISEIFSNKKIYEDLEKINKNELKKYMIIDLQNNTILPMFVEINLLNKTIVYYKYKFPFRIKDLFINQVNFTNLEFNDKYYQYEFTLCNNICKMSTDFNLFKIYQNLKCNEFGLLEILVPDNFFNYVKLQYINSI